MKWEEKVRQVEPYVPGEQPKLSDMIKLNTNESPYPPSPKVQEELALLEAADFRLYPDPQSTDLVAALAGRYHVGEEQVFVGVGSDDVISQVFLTFFSHGEPILFPQLTYSFYEVWADLYRISYVKVPLMEDRHIDPEDYCKPEEKGGIIFPNPNAPTGLLESIETVEQIVKANPDCVVVVDEAYIDFGGKSAIPLIEKYENLLIVQTFSKSRAMAGMRIGFAIGSKKLIDHLQAVKYSINSYTMSRAAIRLGVAAVRDDEYFRETTGKIIATRERVKKELADLGFTFPDSQTNFIFARHKNRSGKELYEVLRSQKIFVRRWDDPLIKDDLRITIGTDTQMDKMLDVLRMYIG
ncbi:MAG: histidinol-phosphate transaminase [Lachnospiraceae bacterium]|nr:histidinol-phosphate transaminase [Lachnospiraceae bacterium]